MLLCLYVYILKRNSLCWKARKYSRKEDPRNIIYPCLSNIRISAYCRQRGQKEYNIFIFLESDDISYRPSSDQNYLFPWIEYLLLYSIYIYSKNRSRCYKFEKILFFSSLENFEKNLIFSVWKFFENNLFCQHITIYYNKISNQFINYSNQE